MNEIGLPSLYKHQQIAFERYKNASIIPLFFDPGTGKTRTILEIAQYKYRARQIDSLLVIAPNGVHRQWAEEECPKWLKLYCHIYYNNSPTTFKHFKLDQDPFGRPYLVWYRNIPLKHFKELGFTPTYLNILCVNVDQFSTKSKWSIYRDWALEHKCFIVLDESTSIKNPKALRTQRILEGFNDIVRRRKAIIKSTPMNPCRAILTGTPVTNGPFDVWAPFEFLQPGYFGMNYYAFRQKYGLEYKLPLGTGRFATVLITRDVWRRIQHCNTPEEAYNLFGITSDVYGYICLQSNYTGPYRNLEDLQKRIAKHASSVRIEDVIDMPPSVYQKRFFELTAEQAKAYKELQNNFVTQYKKTVVSVQQKIGLLVKLSQITSGFMLSQQMSEEREEDYESDVDMNLLVRTSVWFDKQPKLDQLLEDVHAIVHPEMGTHSGVIIITHFIEEADRIYKTLVDHGYRVGLQTGWSKIGTLDDFNSGRTPILVANIRVISKGFNLQKSCCYMIFYSNTFSLEDRVQVEARIHRSGQTKTCVFIDYLVKDTVDEQVYQALKSKQSLLDFVRNIPLEQLGVCNNN